MADMPYPTRGWWALATLLLGALVPAAASALAITAYPSTRPLALDSVEIRWRTDTAADSRVEWAADGSCDPLLIDSDPSPTVSHSVILSGLISGGTYCFRVVSTQGPDSVEASGWYIAPAALAEIPLPEAGAILSGVAAIQAAPIAPSIQPYRVDFYYIALPDGGPVLIGSDHNGADMLWNSFQAGTPGDGWSTSWDTSLVAEGTYAIKAQLTTDIGLLETEATVYLDQTPPIPTIRAPTFSEQIQGRYDLFIDGGSGEQAKFEKRASEPCLTFPATNLQQTDFKFDGKDGKVSCDPTAEAAILWRYPQVRDKVRGEKECKDKPEDKDERNKCAQRELVRRLVQLKQTDDDGTSSNGERNGSKAAFKYLGLTGWNYSSSSPRDFAAFKRACTANPGAKPIKGVVVGVRPVGNPAQMGHALALTSISDTKKRNGKYDVCFMDPLAGGEVCVEIGSDKAFELPVDERLADGTVKSAKLKVQIDRVAVFTGPETDLPRRRISQTRTASSDDWQLIALDDDGSDGWSASWDTAAETPGFYWLRVQVTDTLGHTGEDLVEVALGGAGQPGSPGPDDIDGDGIGDACDPCAGGGAIVDARLILSGFATPEDSDDRIVFKGNASLRAGAVLNPDIGGARIIVEDALGSHVIDASIPPGAYDDAVLTGWKTNARRDRWTYVNRSPVGAAINKLAIRAVGSALRFKASGKRGAFATRTPALPLRATLVTEPPGGLTGGCSEVDFSDAASGATCATHATTGTIRCR